MVVEVHCTARVRVQRCQALEDSRTASVQEASSAESGDYLSPGAMSANHILANTPSSSLETNHPEYAVIDPEVRQVATCLELPAELVGESSAEEDEARTDG